jgi:hypothetical protein
MAKKPTLTDIAANGFAAITTYNANQDAIEAAFDNTLSRDGSTPNSMEANLDMNSNYIINLLDPVNNQDAVTKLYLSTAISNAMLAGVTPSSLGIVTDITALQGLTGAAGQTVLLTGRTTAGDGGGGIFYWTSSDVSTDVTNDPSSAIYVAPTGEDGSSGAWVRMYNGAEVWVEWFGADATGTSTCSSSFNNAIAWLNYKHSGGTFRAGAGTFLLNNTNVGAASWDNKRCIYIPYDNIKFKGSGVDITFLKLDDDENAHTIKIGSRVTETVTVSNVELSDFTLNGNRANQDTPDDTDDHQGGVSVSNGCERVYIHDAKIHDTMYYGIGFQRENINECLVDNVEVYNTGADGIDCKDDNDDTKGNVIRNCRFYNNGLLTGLSGEQASVDLRSGWHIDNCVVLPGASSNCLYGIRLQNGTLGAIPVQPTIVTNCYVDGVDATTSHGIRAITRDTRIENCVITDFTNGLSVTSVDCSYKGLYIKSCDVGARLWGSGGTEADSSTFEGCTFRSNGTGVVADSVDEVAFMGCHIRGNTGTGLDIRSGCTNIQYIGGSISGNGTNVSDLGTSTRMSNISGYRTFNKVQGSFDLTSTSVQTITVAHGLPFTPNIDDITIQEQLNTDVGDYTIRWMKVYNPDATNVVAKLALSGGSGTGGATSNLIFTINSKR